MTLTEINPKGNFDTWKKDKLNEVKNDQFSSNLGKPLFENNSIKLWEIQLKPSETTPFRRHTQNYSATSFSDGLMVSRNTNGRIVLIRLKKGDNLYFECQQQEIIHDLENIGESTIKIIVLEEKLVQQNSYL